MARQAAGYSLSVCSWGLLLDAGGGTGGGTPLAVLESLVALQAFAAELWSAPEPSFQTLCRELGLGCRGGVDMGRWWEGPGLVLFVDGAHDGPGWRMGGFSSQVGVRSALARVCSAESQQLVELQALAWGVRLAGRLGYRVLTLISDSEVGIAQLMGLRAKNVLKAQQQVLRGLVRSLLGTGLVVRVLWVQSGLQPADPMSRLDGKFGGDKLKAEMIAWLIYR